MAGKSTYASDTVLDLFFGSTVYIALYSSAPTDAGGGTEISWTDYTRETTTWCTPTAYTGGGLQVYNTATITFTPNPSITPVTIVAFGLLDADTGGNLLYWGSTGNFVASQSKAISWLAGELIVVED